MLSNFLADFIRDFLTEPKNNNLGPGTSDPAWDGFLLGFSAGDDDLYLFWKDHIGPFHWTPREAFALGTVGNKATPYLPPVVGQRVDAHQAHSAVPAASELKVISWALCQTEATKAANRAQTRFPSEAWARARIYGQGCNRSLHRALIEALAGQGHPAVAPALLPEAGDRESPSYGQAFNWSERHVAYTSGLGTFGLCGGLITRRGQAVRLGSLVVHGHVEPTPRHYSSPFAYCLSFNGASCAACAERCPTGSVREETRDKKACARYLAPCTADYVRRKYGFDGYGCGMCQTAVPCESAIPVAPGPHASA